MTSLYDVKLTKCNLRGLLLSKIGGVPLNSLLSDYKKLYDEELNFKSLGVPSLLDFLKTIPEIATVQPFKDGQMRVYGTSANDMNTTSKKAAKDHKKIVKTTNVPNLLTIETTTQCCRQPVKDFSDLDDIHEQNGKAYLRKKCLVHIEGIPSSATIESLSAHLRYYNFEDLKIFKRLKGSEYVKYGSIMLPIVEAEKLFLDQTVKYFKSSKLFFNYPNEKKSKSEISTQALNNIFCNGLSSKKPIHSIYNVSDSQDKENGCHKIFKEKPCNRTKDCLDQIPANFLGSPSETVFRYVGNGYKDETCDRKKDCFEQVSANIVCSPNETSYSMMKSHLNYNTAKQHLIYIKGIHVDIHKETLHNHLKSHGYNAENVKIKSFKTNRCGSALLPEEEIEKLLNDQAVRILGNSLLSFCYPKNQRNPIFFPALEGNHNETSDADKIETDSTVRNLLTEKNQTMPENLMVYVENLPFHAKLEDVLESFQSYRAFQAKMLSADKGQEERPICLLNFHHVDDVIKLYRDTDTLVVLDRPVRLDFSKILPEIKKFLKFENLIITRITKKKRIVTEPMVINLNAKTDKRIVTKLMVVEYAEPSIDKLPVSMSRYSLTLMYNDVFPCKKMHSKEDFKSEINLVVTHTESNYSDYFWGVPSMTDKEVKKVSDMNQLESSFKPFDFRSRRAIIRHNGFYCRVWVKSVVNNTVEVFFVDYGNTENTSVDKLLTPPDDVWDISPKAVPFRVKEGSLELVNNLNKLLRFLLVGTEGLVFVVANLAVLPLSNRLA